MTEREAYESFADFIQDYIYEKKWEHLNSMQIRAAELIGLGTHNLLLTAGTAMGKTEAAFMPAISQIYRRRRDSVGILYISPLKALINDQFTRIEEMLAGTGLRITKWHGDASVSKKERLLSMPGGILQTTPESLEAMLCRHPENVRILFSSLEYVIIDEIHYFMNSQRGLQLLAALERVQRLIGRKPLRIGLSATIRNAKTALGYLNAGTGREGEVVDYQEECRRYVVSVSVTQTGRDEYPEEYIGRLLEESRGKRALLFTNSRRECEILIARVKDLALANGMPDCYYVHHGSISKDLREETELAMKQAEGPVLTGTTLTLELGIDIGDLDLVIQAAQPMSISSMVQRVGRSGRRTRCSAIAFHLRCLRSDGSIEGVSLGLVRTIAMIELYFREQYLEEVRAEGWPFNLLVHEILAAICEKGCMRPPVLAESVLELGIFRNVTQAQLASVLRELIAKDVLMVYEDGAIGLSDTGERFCNRMDFYAVFEAEESFVVRCGEQEIGALDKPYKKDTCFFLAGKTWRVVGCDLKKKRIDVVPDETASAAITFSSSGMRQTDQRTMEKIHEILDSDRRYQYLDEEADELLLATRHLAERYRLTELLTEEDGTDNVLIFPCAATDAIRTLQCLLGAHRIPCERLFLDGTLYGIRVFAMTKERLARRLKRLGRSLAFVPEEYLLQRFRKEGKYFEYLPDDLKYLEICRDVLDIGGALQIAEEIVEVFAQ